MGVSLVGTPEQDDPVQVRAMEVCTIQLERMITQGNDETPEGEQLRDQMELIWWQLSTETQKRLAGLAIDLAWLFALRADYASEGQIEEGGAVAAGISAAVTNAAWDEVLQGLRRYSIFTPRRIAELRSIAYEAIGFHEAAALFAERAAQLNKHTAIAA